MALGLPPETANTLLESAGFAPAFPRRTWSDEAMAPIRDAAQAILLAHQPAPAVLVDEACDILSSNDAFEVALDLFGGRESPWRSGPQTSIRNLLKITLHPDGPARSLLNFADVARATLARATAEARRSARLNAVLSEVANYPNVDQDWLVQTWAPAPGPVIEERYRIGSETVRLFSVITTMGTPMDAAARALRIESFFPVDQASREFMTRVLARSPKDIGEQPFRQ